MTLWTRRQDEDGERCERIALIPGWGLIKSNNPDMQTEGIKLLQGELFSTAVHTAAVPVAHDAEIYSASPSHRRECSYYIAVGYYKLRQYANAKRFNGELVFRFVPECSSARLPVPALRIVAGLGGKVAVLSLHTRACSFWHRLLAPKPMSPY